MKKRIIYGIGGTGSAIVNKLKSIESKEFNDTTIYRVWDIDSATSNLTTLDDSEKNVFLGENIQRKIRTIKDDRDNYPSLYDEIYDIFPIDDEKQINFLPSSESIGAAKQPIVSRLVGTIYTDEIRATIKNDCELAENDTTKNAYLILSSCGGTSSGLNIQVYIELIRKEFNVFLFFVSPNYFNEVLPDKRDKNVNAANTVATFLRIFYDLEKRKILYADEQGLDINSEIYPFIIESEWSTGTKRAEFIYNPQKHNTSEEFFYMYNALAISSFFRVNTNRSQTFISSYMNRFSYIREDKSFFNMLLLYPINNTRDRIKSAINEQLNRTNGRSGRENLSNLLTPNNPEYELLTNAQNVLSLLEPKVEYIDNDFHIKDIYNILIFAKTHLDDNNVRNKWDTKQAFDSPFTFEDDCDNNEEHEKTGFFAKIANFFKKIWGVESDEFETNIVENQLNTGQKNAVKKLYNYLNEKLTKYEVNYKSLTNEAEFPFNPVNFDLVGNTELDIDLNKFFTNDFQIEEIIKTVYKKELLTDIVTPPSLRQWSDNSQSIYSYNEIINGNHYLLRIHTEITDHALEYLRGENIKSFTERKQEKILCYPDKRLNGIFPPDNEIFENFLIWEDKIIETLCPKGSKASFADEIDIALLALALTSDSISNIEMPKKVLDLNKKGDNFYIEALIKIDSHKEKKITGKETSDWYKAPQVFEQTIKEVNKDDPFETKVLDEIKIHELIILSHKQILDYCITKDNISCLKETYNKLKAFKSSLPDIENDKIEEVNEMIDDINIYLTGLAAEYRKTIFESKIKIPPIPLND